MFSVRCSKGEVMVKKPQLTMTALKRELKNSLARVTELEGLVKELQGQLHTDPLTKIGNRRSYVEGLDATLARANRGMGEPVSLAVIDIDHFKKVNDTYGHQAGDQVLVGLATFLKKNTRAADTICRIGGEEFVLILPGTSINVAWSLLTRLGKLIASGLSITVSGITIPITVSIGVAAWRRGDGQSSGETAGELFERADSALYEAKNSGRNRVCVAS